MSEPQKPKTRACQARVEYLAVQTEVEEKLDAGYSRAMIYDQLCEAGRLTISYTAFCDYVRGRGKRLHKGSFRRRR